MLLVRLVHHTIVWAVVDPWEIRGVDRFDASAMLALDAALTGVILRTRPSAVVLVAAMWTPRLVARVQGVAERRGLPVLVPTTEERRAIRSLAHTFAAPMTVPPELAQVRAGTVRRTALLALAALAILQLPPRRYVSRLTSRPASCLDTPGAQRARTP